MRILEMPAPEQLVLREVPRPELRPGCAVIRMEYCGICGSDLTAYTGKNPTVRYPVAGIGHEGIGIIEEIGENVQGLRPGDRVALEPYIPCRRCHMCAAERFNNCTDIRVAGVHTGGMMADYVVFPTAMLHKVPQGLDPLDAALTEPLTIGLHAASRAGVSPGEYCVQFARAGGITYTFNSAQGDLPAYLQEVAGDLPQTMLECTGSPVILAAMHDYVHHGGRIALVGWPKGPVTVNTVRCIQKELDIRPSRNSNKQFPASLSLIASGQIPTRRLITKVVELADTEAVMLDMMAHPGNYIKVVVRL